MKKWPFIILALVFSPALSSAGETHDYRIISTFAEAKEDAAPDTAVIGMAVETAAETVKAATSENNRRMEKVLSELKKAAGAGDEVKTSSFSVRPVHEYDGRRNILKGYTAFNGITVKTRSVVEAGRFIDIALNSGANNISDLRFELSDYTKVCAIAIEKAASKAKALSEASARAFGVRLGPVKDIAPNCRAYGQEEPVVRFGLMEKAVDTSTPVEPGTTAVSATVEVRYFIAE
ncbi:MAG: SIMPL domain-containing protein [Deltaproteobacteria bacterium]|nr:SIMPL domain-containing protein [Deltaproteobacteria bacterium]